MPPKVRGAAFQVHLVGIEHDRPLATVKLSHIVQRPLINTGLEICLFRVDEETDTPRACSRTDSIQRAGKLGDVGAGTLRREEGETACSRARELDGYIVAGRGEGDSFQGPREPLIDFGRDDGGCGRGGGGGDDFAGVGEDYARVA